MQRGAKGGKGSPIRAGVTITFPLGWAAKAAERQKLKTEKLKSAPTPALRPLHLLFCPHCDNVRPGSLNAAEVAREFQELRGRGVGADGLARAIQIEAAHFAERKPGNESQSG